MHVHCPTSGLVGTEHRVVSLIDTMHNAQSKDTLHNAQRKTQCTMHNAQSKDTLHNAQRKTQCTMHNVRHNAMQWTQCNSHSSNAQYDAQCNCTSYNGIQWPQHQKISTRLWKLMSYFTIVIFLLNCHIIAGLSHTQNNCKIVFTTISPLSLSNRAHTWYLSFFYTCRF